MTKQDEEEDYHGVAPIKPIIKKMKKDYDKDPKGWSVVGSHDDQGNSDTVILKNSNAFWLKSKMLSPYSALSMGSIVKNIDKEIDESIGIKRELSPDEMLRLFGMIVPINPDKNIIATGIERYSQHQGNILKKVIYEQNPNLDHQLAKRIDDEFTKKYPQRKNMYI
jgi:hypothetical protein